MNILSNILQSKLLKKGKMLKFNSLLHKGLIYRKMRQKYNLNVFKALTNLSPTFDLIPVRISGRIYKIPTVVTPIRSLKLAKSFFKTGMNSKNDQSILKKFKTELKETAYDKMGLSTKLLTNYQQTATLNRAFTNYRWK